MKISSFLFPCSYLIIASCFVSSCSFREVTPTPERIIELNHLHEGAMESKYFTVNDGEIINFKCTLSNEDIGQENNHVFYFRPALESFCFVLSVKIDGTDFPIVSKQSDDDHICWQHINELGNLEYIKGNDVNSSLRKELEIKIRFDEELKTGHAIFCWLAN